MPRTIDFYYWPTEDSWKVAIALEEMDIRYKLIPVEAGTNVPRHLAPNGRVPAIVDPTGPEGAPIPVFGAGAILRYLADQTGQFRGDTARDRVAVDEWLTWQSENLTPISQEARHYLKEALLNQPSTLIPYAQQRYRTALAELYDILEQQLTHQAYLAGAYSIADMALWPSVQGWADLGQTLDDKPHLTQWLVRVGARPAVICGQALGAALSPGAPRSA